MELDWQTVTPNPDEAAPDRGRHDARRTAPRRRVRHALVGLIEHDILPRLMHTGHIDPPAAPNRFGVLAPPAHVAILPAHVQALVDLSLHSDGHRARDHVMRLRDEGAAIESLYLDLLTPAARRLGVLWETDECDFVMVTLGLLRIQQVMYDLSPEFMRDASAPTARRVLLAPVPGSHHTFGIAMVADFFRHDGWDVTSSHEFSRSELVRAVRSEWFDVVGFSISAPAQINVLAPLVAEVRKSSNNRGILILVGGPLAASVPDLASRTGADMMTLDAQEAVNVAGRAIPVRTTMAG